MRTIKVILVSLRDRSSPSRAWRRVGSESLETQRMGRRAINCCPRLSLLLLLARSLRSLATRFLARQNFVLDSIIRLTILLSTNKISMRSRILIVKTNQSKLQARLPDKSSIIIWPKLLIQRDLTRILKSSRSRSLETTRWRRPTRQQRSNRRLLMRLVSLQTPRANSRKMILNRNWVNSTKNWWTQFEAYNARRNHQESYSWRTSQHCIARTLSRLGASRIRSRASRSSLRMQGPRGFTTSRLRRAS